METRALYDAIRMHNRPLAAQSIIKHLKAVEIHDWADLTKVKLNDFKDELDRTVCASTAKTYMAVLRATLRRYDEEFSFTKGYQEVLKGKIEKPVKPYLTLEELYRFENVEATTPASRIVKIQSLLEAYTGCRISDVQGLSVENLVNGYVTYTSVKTGVTATVPLKPQVREWIEYAKAHEADQPTMMGRGKILKTLCQKAGIDTPTKVFKAGKTLVKPKYEFVSSHIFRISFCTNLAILGVPIQDISQMAGHTSPDMTKRYISNYDVVLPDTAKQYFE